MAEEGTKVSAGLKLWMNTLKSEDNSGSVTSDSAILIGPAVEAEFSNNVFVEGSYVMTATKYKIGQSEIDRNH